MGSYIIPGKTLGEKYRCDTIVGRNVKIEDKKVNSKKMNTNIK